MVELMEKLMLLFGVTSYDELFFVVFIIPAAIILIPTLILFSRYIYLKYGVFTTCFNTRLFDFRTEFKLFMKQSKINFSLGWLTRFFQICGGIFFCWFLIKDLFFL